jgi:hypothetical protein
MMVGQIRLTFLVDSKTRIKWKNLQRITKKYTQN